MRYRWLWAALAVMLSSVAVVYAAPDAGTGDRAPTTGSTAVAGPRPATRLVRVPDEVLHKPALVLGGRPGEWELDQGTWTRMIDDFEEGIEPSPFRGWARTWDTNGSEFGEYYWAISDCRAKAGRRSLWAIAGGADGRQMACGTNYPHGVSSSVWLNLDLSHWPTDTQRLQLLFDFWLNLRTVAEGNVVADGLFVNYMLPVTGKEDNYERITLINYTTRHPNSFWYEPGVVDLVHATSVYPDGEGNFPTYNLAGQSQVYIEFLFQTARSPFEVHEDGAFIDNVRLVADSGPEGTIVPPPTLTPAPTTEVPPETTEPPPVTTEPPPVTTEPPPSTTEPVPTVATPTPIAGRESIFLPAVLCNSDFAEIVPITPEPSTAVPTGEPTDVPTEEPSPEPTTAPGEPICRDWLVNGDFEAGPDVGWDLVTQATIDGRPVALSDVILKYADVPGLQTRPTGGEWLAFLGNGYDVQMSLVQQEAVDLLPAERVVSATLMFDLALLTEEPVDGTAVDGFAIFVVDQSDQATQLGALTEETPSLVPAAWQQWRIDFASFVATREGWETSRLMLTSIQNDALLSQHFLDNVSLMVCESAAPVPPAVRARTPRQAPTFTVRALPGRPLPATAGRVLRGTTPVR